MIHVMRVVCSMKKHFKIEVYASNQRKNFKSYETYLTKEILPIIIIHSMYENNTKKIYFYGLDKKKYRIELLNK